MQQNSLRQTWEKWHPSGICWIRISLGGCWLASAVATCNLVIHAVGNTFFCNRGYINIFPWYAHVGRFISSVRRFISPVNSSRHLNIPWTHQCWSFIWNGSRWLDIQAVLWNIPFLHLHCHFLFFFYFFFFIFINQGMNWQANNCFMHISVVDINFSSLLLLLFQQNQWHL